MIRVTSANVTAVGRSIPRGEVAVLPPAVEKYLIERGHAVKVKPPKKAKKPKKG